MLPPLLRLRYIRVNHSGESCKDTASWYNQWFPLARKDPTTWVRGVLIYIYAYVWADFDCWWIKTWPIECTPHLSVYSSLITAVATLLQQESKYCWGKLDDVAALIFAVASASSFPTIPQWTGICWSAMQSILFCCLQNKDIISVILDA